MNRLLLPLLFMAPFILAAPVPLDGLPGVNLPGVRVEMTKEALLGLHLTAIPMVFNSTGRDKLSFAVTAAATSADARMDRKLFLEVWESCKEPVAKVRRGTVTK
jgi:hypothetical protein